MKIYISTPITGVHPDEYEQLINIAASTINTLGCIAVTPLSGNYDNTWVNCMKNDIKKLIACDAILIIGQLDKIMKSQGCMLENVLADSLNIRKEFVTTGYQNTFDIKENVRYAVSRLTHPKHPVYKSKLNESKK